MESADNKEDLRNSDGKFNQDVYSKVVRAGKRTYFFDVKSTRNEEYYLTITESKKRFEDNGDFHYEKHKIFLYREDFEKFTDCLHEIVGYINKNQLPLAEKNNDEVESSEPAATFTGVDFEDI